MFQEIVILNVRQAKRSIRQAVSELDSANKCVNCKKQVTKPEVRRRGRCANCYYSYRMERLSLGSDAKRIAFEGQQIAAGKLMPDRQGKKTSK